MSDVTADYSLEVQEVDSDEPEARWMKEYERKKLATIEGQRKIHESP